MVPSRPREREAAISLIDAEQSPDCLLAFSTTSMQLGFCFSEIKCVCVAKTAWSAFSDFREDGGFLFYFFFL